MPDSGRACGRHTAGSAAHGSRLLCFAGLAAVALSTAAFVLWTRNGAGILLDMMLALCV
ncbi:MAG: hypothetical protein AB7H90_08760 [Alphaproteobacteria bacterium]